MSLLRNESVLRNTSSLRNEPILQYISVFVKTIFDMTKQVMVKILGHVVAVPEVVPLAVEAAAADQWAAVVVAPDPCLTRIIGEFKNRFKF